MTPEQIDALPVGTVLRTHNGSQWTKLPSGEWNVDSDPGWGPHESSDIPFYAEVYSVPQYYRCRAGECPPHCSGH